MSDEAEESSSWVSVSEPDERVVSLSSGSDTNNGSSDQHNVHEEQEQGTSSICSFDSSSTSGDSSNDNVSEILPARPLMIDERAANENNQEFVARAFPTPRWRQRRRRNDVSDVDDHVDTAEHHHDRDAYNSRPATTPPGSTMRRIRRRIKSNWELIYVFGACLTSAYLVWPNVSQIQVADNAPIYDPWDQGDEFRDRSPLPKRAKKKMKRIKAQKDKNRVQNVTEEKEEETVVVPGSDEKQPTSDADDPFPQLLHWKLQTNYTSADEGPIFFWFVPGSNGGILVKILEQCYRVNVTKKAWHHGLLLPSTITKNVSDDAVTQANHSIDQGRDMNEDSSLSPAILATPKLLKSVALIFNDKKNITDVSSKGRCISVFMHPIERAIRSYHQIRLIASQVSNNTVPNITLEEYARGPYSDENLLVRELSNRTNNQILRWMDLEAAMDFVSRKCLVGIVGDDKRTLWRSIKHFEKSLALSELESTRSCTEEIMNDWKNKFHGVSTQRVSMPAEDSTAWDMLMRKNAYDIKLYERVLGLFEEQDASLNISYVGVQLWNTSTSSSRVERMSQLVSSK